MKAPSSCFTHSNGSSSTRQFHPLFHSLHVLLCSFLWLYTFLSFSCQLLSCVNSPTTKQVCTTPVPNECHTVTSFCRSLNYSCLQSNCNSFSYCLAMQGNSFPIYQTLNITCWKFVIAPMFQFYHITSLLQFDSQYYFSSFLTLRQSYSFSLQLRHVQFLSNSSLCPSISKLPYHPMPIFSHIIFTNYAFVVTVIFSCSCY